MLNGNYTRINAVEFNANGESFIESCGAGRDFSGKGLYRPESNSRIRFLTADIADWSYVEMKIRSDKLIYLWARGESDASGDSDPDTLLFTDGDWGTGWSGATHSTGYTVGSFKKLGYLFKDGEGYVFIDGVYAADSERATPFLTNVNGKTKIAFATEPANFPYAVEIDYSAFYEKEPYGPPITDRPITAITFSQPSLLVSGDTHTLAPILAPLDTSDTGLSYSSSDTDVATVDDLGVVTQVGYGIVDITVTSKVNIMISGSIELFFEELSAAMVTLSDVPSGTLASLLTGDYNRVNAVEFNTDADSFIEFSSEGTSFAGKGFYRPNETTGGTIRFLTADITDWSYLEIKIQTNKLLNLWARGETVSGLGSDSGSEDVASPDTLLYTNGNWGNGWGGTASSNYGVVVTGYTAGTIKKLGYLFTADKGYVFINGVYT